jgi:hypothetical protein
MNENEVHEVGTIDDGIHAHPCDREAHKFLAKVGIRKPRCGC